MNARVLLVGAPDEQLEELNLDLMQAGFLTETAADAKECLEVGFWFQPHLVVTEVELSEFSGLELALFISSGQAGFSAKVIFYTHAYRDERSRQATVTKYGASGYFVKQSHKQALLKTVIQMLTSIALEGKAKVALPPFPNPDRDRANPQSWTPDRLAAAISENQALIVRSKGQKPHEQRPESGQKGTATATDSRVVEVAAPVKEVSLSIPPRPQAEPRPNSAPKEHLSPSHVSSDTEIWSESPSRNEVSEVPLLRIPGELKGVVLSKKSRSKGATILFAAAAAVLAIGVSISLWLSRSPVAETSPPKYLQRDQTPSLNRGGPTASPAPPVSARPVEPSDPDPASEALIRLLSESKTGESTRTQARATAPQSQKVRRRTPDQ